MELYKVFMTISQMEDLQMLFDNVEDLPESLKDIDGQITDIIFNTKD